MKTGASLKNRQGGAVAVMVGISMVLLIGFLAMVIDLGHLYVAKTGLQNAADAAALSGAKELKGTSAGVGFAKDKAIEAAGLNTFFANSDQASVVLLPSSIQFGVSKSGPWVDFSTAQASPSDKLFIKVDTASGNLTTWFAPIWNILNMSTYGRAVAGPLMVNIAPIGLCVLSPEPSKWVEYDAGGGEYQAEFGYMRGVNYNFGVINGALSGLGPGTELYLHPSGTEEGCIQSHGSADFAAPFLCTGRTAISGAASSVVYTNTGLAAGKSLGALNTRFDQYGGPIGSSLDSNACPPDTNVQEYPDAVASNWMTATQPPIDQAAIYRLADWLHTTNASGIRDTTVLSQIKAGNEKNNSTSGCGGNCTDNYGVLWSYNRPAVSGVAAASSVAEVWSQLNPEGPTYKGAASSVPWVSSSVPWTAPYAASSVPYFKAPTGGHDGVAGRRVLNVVLVQCPAASGGICREMTVRGVGRFFMQTMATNPDGITGEFAGLVPESALKREIRLFP